LSQNENQRIELGGKVLTSNFCSQKDATDLHTSDSTVEVSNIVLKCLEKKCDDISHNTTGQGVHVSEDIIPLPLSKERYDIMTYHYLLDDFSSKSNFHYNSDVTLQHVG
jgi:hypothetical protein